MKKIQNNARLNCFIAFIDTRLKGIGVAEDNGKSVIKNNDLISQIELIGEDIIKYTSNICTLDKVNFIIQKSISFLNDELMFHQFFVLHKFSIDLTYFQSNNENKKLYRQR